MRISKINIGGVLYDILDALLTSTVAELIEQIASLSGALKWVGFTTTPLTDGSTTNPIVINGQQYTAESGDVAAYATHHDNVYAEDATGGYILKVGELILTPVVGHTVRVTSGTSSAMFNKYYKITSIVNGNVCTLQEVSASEISLSSEFVYNGSLWQEFGSTGSLGALAFKDSVSATYTPAGTVSAPTISATVSTQKLNTDTINYTNSVSVGQNSSVLKVTPVDVLNAGAGFCSLYTPDSSQTPIAAIDGAIYLVVSHDDAASPYEGGEFQDGHYYKASGSGNQCLLSHYGQSSPLDKLAVVEAVRNTEQGASNDDYILNFDKITVSNLSSEIIVSSGNKTFATGAISAGGSGSDVVTNVSGFSATTPTFSGTAATITSR